MKVNEFGTIDGDLAFIANIMMKLSYSDPCIRFGLLADQVGWHRQKLLRVLRRGIRMGVIAKCGDGSYELVMPIFRSVVEKEDITLNVVRLTNGGLVVNHNVHVILRNTGLMDMDRVFVRVYGDLDWGEPLRFTCCGVTITEKLNRIRCPHGFCNFIFRLGRAVKSGETIRYGYSFNLYYYMPMDYFSIDAINHIKRLIIRVPRSFNEWGIRIEDAELLGNGFMTKHVNNKHNILVGKNLMPPTVLKMRIAFLRIE